MIDIGIGFRGRDDLRIHTHAGKIDLIATHPHKLQVEIFLAFLEILDQFHGAGVADGVTGRADGAGEVVHHPRAGPVLLVLGDVCEAELVVFRGYGGVVDGVVAAVSVVRAAAVADPHDVPVFAVGGGGHGGAEAGGVVDGLKGPVDYCLDAFGD